MWARDLLGVLRLRVVGLCLLAAASAAGARPAGHRPAASAGQTEAQLRALRERIETVSRVLSRDAVASDQLAQSLRSAELAVTGAHRALGQLQAQAAAQAQRRAALATEREAKSRTLVRERSSLAAQLRLAYQIGRHEPLQLMLNQRDPAQANRLMVWYRYFGLARADQIAAIGRQVRDLDALDAALAQQDAVLAQLSSAQALQVQELEHGRNQRQQALANLQIEARGHSASLARLQAQQADLERLLRELTRAAPPAAPLDTHSAFGRLRGQLEWPVMGRVVARYGEARAGGVKWRGTVVATTQGAAVRAVSPGRVLYADWLPGLGLLVIVDHGGGYLSLYGYNGELRKAAGENVAGGEILATAGDTGGRPEPQLYFEIRFAGKPLDPQGWFRHRAPE